jgi:hypothetical protein
MMMILFRCLSQITNQIRAQTTTTINLESVSRFSKKETTLSILFFPSAKNALLIIIIIPRSARIRSHHDKSETSDIAGTSSLGGNIQ